MRRIITDPIRVQSKDGRIIGEYLTNGKLKVFTGSFFRNVEVNSIRQNIKNERMYLINNGYINNHQLIKDYIFENPSTAISVLMGRMESGNQSFVTMDNIELGEYLEADIVTNYEQKLKLKELLLKADELKQNDFTNFVNKDNIYEVVTTNSMTQSSTYEASYIPELKPDKVLGEKSSYRRDNEKAKKSIALANYKCELDGSHQTFNTSNGKPYMEAHHLIPLSTQDYFEYSLDVDANIVCLCPTCHRKLHYGNSIRDDLKRLYDLRIRRLKQSGIDITFDELIKLYQ
ncbi:MAG: HNH endonuclease [Bacilli bacterium]